MAEKYDVAIIGAGHNGLIAAYYLAKAGKKVVVFEKKENVGGRCVTEEITEGFRSSVCLDDISLFSKKVFQDLGLKNKGISAATDPLAISLLPGKALIQWRSPQKFAQEIATFSEKDAKEYPKYHEFMDKVAKNLGIACAKTPPDILNLPHSDLVDLGKYWLKLRKMGKRDMLEFLRAASMSARDFLDEWFESDALKGLLAAKALMGNALGPYSPGTAATLFLQHILSYHSASLGHPQGGMGKLSEALEQAGQTYKVEVRKENEVQEILIEEGVVKGVLLQDGTEIHSQVVASSLDPKTTFLKLCSPPKVSLKLRNLVKNVKSQGVSTKINLALKELPHIALVQGAEKEALLSARYFIAPSLEYLEKAFDATKYGRYSENPVIQFILPSFIDPSLAPKNKHVLSITAQCTPFRLREGSWAEHQDKFADIVLEKLGVFLPNLKDIIEHRQVLSPSDLEANFSLNEGHIYHLDHTMDQLFLMRPIPGSAQYRTPLDNLYLCGAGTHPAGMVNGLAGHNAAQKILKDWKG